MFIREHVIRLENVYKVYQMQSFGSNNSNSIPRAFWDIYGLHLNIVSTDNDQVGCIAWKSGYCVFPRLLHVRYYERLGWNNEIKLKIQQTFASHFVMSLFA